MLPRVVPRGQTAFHPRRLSRARRRGNVLAAVVVAVAGTLAPNPAAEQSAQAVSATVERLAGTDRYATAAAISRATFAPGTAPAFIASGLDFPDALAGGPAAGRLRAPILLVAPNAVPESVRVELTRLQPTSIVVLGGPSSVSDGVASTLGGFTSGGVTRIAGPNRFATAAAISAAYFAPNVPVAYVATGRNYPDALGAGPAAAALGGPVLLVDTNDVPSVVRTELTRLHPGRIVVVGGPTVVSNAVVAVLDGYTAGPVTRQAGPDRYATAAAISATAFPAQVQTVHVASGMGFADALAGVPAAAALGGPLLLSAPTWLPPATAAELGRLNPARVRLLGGPSTLSDALVASVQAATAPDRVGPFTFQVDGYTLKTVAEEALAYNANSLVAIYGTRDASGAFIFQHTDGKWYDHPVGQAQYIVNMLRNYRVKPDPQYLDLAIANGNRLLERAVSHAGGIFFPYGMDFVLHGRGTMTAPWYSGMAQGIALSGFVRLHEVTGEQKWLDAAHATFASFKVGMQAGKPWVTAVENGLLWFEEYPWVPFDHTFNGHNFATYGLYDYWRITGSREAETLTLGGITTSARASGTVRVPGGVSHYCIAQSCLDRLVRNRLYHLVHIGQFIQLHRYTNSETFARLADTFTADYPEYRFGGTAIFAPGTHTGYAFDTTGVGRAVKSTTNPTGSNAPFGERSVPYGWIKPGNGIWLFITAGYFEGLWVRESASAYARGFVDRLEYYWPRSVSVPAGTRTGYKFDATGTVTATLSASTAATSWAYSARARINGTPGVLLTSGPLVGYWLPVAGSAGITAQATVDGAGFTDPALGSVAAADDAPTPPAPLEDPLIPAPMPGQLELAPGVGPPEAEPSGDTQP